MDDVDKTAIGVLDPAPPPVGPGHDVPAQQGDTQTMPVEGATQMAMNVDCPVCHTPNPPSETYCIDCGFLLGSEPVGVAEMPEQPSMGRLISPDGTREFALHAGPNTVGRENADILLAHNTVSRKHATITVEDHRAYVEDAGSTNGTTVDGVKIAPGEKTDLKDGSEIVFGSFAVKYQAPEGAEPEQAEPPEEAEPEAETCELEPVEPAAEETPEQAPVEAVARLVSKDGAYSFGIHDGTNTIGRREADNDIVIPDPYCSGRHADIAFADGKFTITDVGSTNGTCVNGVKLEANDPRELAEGDEITLGRTVFAIEESKTDSEHIEY